MRFAFALSLVMLAAQASAAPAPLYGIGAFITDTPALPLATTPNTVLALNNQAISGAALLGWQWNVLETADGTYNFAPIDAEVAIITAAGKQYSLGIQAGNYVPTWLLNEDAGAGFATVVENAGGTNCGNAYTIANPLNSTFQTKWAAFIAALAAHVRSGVSYSYANDPNLVIVKVSGSFSNTTNEAILPFGTGQIVNGCQYANDTANWITAGYNGATLVTIAASIIAEWHSAFPTKYLDLMGGPSGFPCIDDTGANAGTNSPWCSVSFWKFVPAAMAAYPSQFIAQTNGLIGGTATNFGTIFSYIAGSAYNLTPGAWQFSDPVVNDVSPSCVMNNGASPCPHLSTMQSVIANSLAETPCHPIYMEVFPADVNDTADYPQSLWDSLNAGLRTQVICPYSSTAE